uniref:Uncharacterized protein n=1 Tax=Aegilops tauschii subsp. strangulata TaxID=200361 RepID=A0A452Y9E9_AEGTS
MIIDHINYDSTLVEGDHTLIAGDDLIQSGVILGSKKIDVSTTLKSLSDPFKHSVPSGRWYLYIHTFNLIKF